MQAFVFPGQGSQSLGMGKELAGEFKVARNVFEEVNSALSQSLSTLMFDGPENALTLTENAQPAIMACSIAALRVLESEVGLSVAKDAAFVAGHSLGEYTALCAAGALSLTDTARLLKLRGQAMQQAVPAGNGAMAALIGADLVQANEIAELAGKNDVCTVANDNAPGQVVISGAKAAIDHAIEIAKAKGVKRALILQVSAPFHSPLMAPAAGIMDEALGVVNMQAPAVPLVANVTATAVFDPHIIKRLLVEQITGQVRWRESVEFLQTQGVTKLIEIGHGKVLTGLTKRIAPNMEAISISGPLDIAALLTALKAAA